MAVRYFNWKLVIILFLCSILFLFSILNGVLLISNISQQADTIIEGYNDQRDLLCINNQPEYKSTPTAVLHSRARQDLVTFENVTWKVGLSGVSGNFFAWGDYNNDEYQDLLLYLPIT